MTAAQDAPTTARRVVRTALTIYRRRLFLVTVTSLVVFSTLALAETVVGLAIERRGGESTGGGVLNGGLWLVSGLWMFGSALFAGLCDTIVSRELGHHEPPLKQAWRNLPFARLIGLDVFVTAVVTVGMVLLVVPGIVAFTLTCIAAPLIVLEDLRVRTAILRSAHLIRPRIVVALAVVTLPVLVEHEVVHAVEAAVGLRFLPLLALHIAGMVLVIAPVTLCEIVLAHDLTGRSIEPVRVEPRRLGARLARLGGLARLG